MKKSWWDRESVISVVGESESTEQKEYKDVMFQCTTHIVYCPQVAAEDYFRFSLSVPVLSRLFDAWGRDLKACSQSVLLLAHDDLLLLREKRDIGYVFCIRTQKAKSKVLWLAANLYSSQSQSGLS
ncbi:hypothetical protein VNO78_15429 [Psophocarpus tetragonolobus]|uniref:Uncharacterized protein n=1 Tax=Psophocarpus tetragonolobus TaxID=3891 RepID=A0AAN9XJW9_PSOTE